LDEAVRTAPQIADALEYAYERGVFDACTAIQGSTIW